MRSIPRRIVIGLVLGSGVLAASAATPAFALAPRPLTAGDFYALSDAHHATGDPYYSGFQTNVSIATVRYKTALALEQN